MPKKKNDHCLNLFIPYELKSALQQASDRCDCSLSEVVRFLLRLGLPILRGICESREVLLETERELLGSLADTEHGESRQTDHRQDSSARRLLT